MHKEHQSRSSGKRTVTPASTSRSISRRSDLPREPGCYLFKDADEKILYIGKAKNLKRRVQSYFQVRDHDAKTQALVSQITSVDVFLTDNEREALILENNLIKRHKPRYNIDLRDSKRYAHLRLTPERFPRLVVARDLKEKGDYYGPFVSAKQRDTLKRFANNVFRIRTCRRLPKRACLRLQMNLCDAPCIGWISEEQYNELTSRTRELLEGRTTELVRMLKQRMKGFSDTQDYENALIIRNQILALESLTERQNMEKQRSYDQDLVNYVLEQGMVHLAVFHVHKGVLSGKNEFDFDESPDFLEEFLLQYYSSEEIPREIILPKRITASLADVLSETRGAAVRLIIPQRGEKRQLLELVKKNIEKSFKENELCIEELQRHLGLHTLPRVIEGFDVSHLSGTNTVASMVRFVDGLPDKSGYRRFRLHIENDDTAGIAEAVGRRYKRLKREQKPLPDLILIDGGPGQLSSALDQLNSLRISRPVVALAKRMELIHASWQDTPIRLSRKGRGLRLLQRVRDEAHRFALTYQKVLRRKRVMGR